MNCQFCTEEFDLDQHLPLTLLCSHNLCKSCSIHMHSAYMIVFCPTCSSRNKNSSELIPQLSLGPTLHSTDNELPISQSTVQLIKDKSMCKCNRDFLPATKLSKKDLKFYCEEHVLDETETLKDFSAIKNFVYSELTNKIFDINEMKEKPKPPSEEYHIENQKYVENLEKLKGLSGKIDEKYSKVEEFVESNKSLFKVIKDTAYFKKKPKFNLQEKVEFLKNSRMIEDYSRPELENFSENLKSSIKILESLEALLNFEIKS